MEEAQASGDKERMQELANRYHANEGAMQELKDDIQDLKDDLGSVQDTRNTNHAQQQAINQQLEAQRQAQEAAAAAQAAQQQAAGGNGGGNAGGGNAGGGNGGAAPVGGNGGNGGGGAAPAGGNGAVGDTGNAGSGAPASVNPNAPTSDDLKGDTAQEQIYNYLKDFGLNDTAIAGVMGNMAQESGYSATNLQNSYESSLGYTDQSYTDAVDSGAYSRDQFIHDSAGYGIVQYTYSGYKEGLYDLAKSEGKSVGDLGVQLEYLATQMSPALVDKLNNAGSAAEAAQIFCNDFEKPGTPNMANRIASAEQAMSLFDSYNA